MAPIEKPSVDGVRAKVRRAEFHLEVFKEFQADFFECKPYRIAGQVHHEGRQHVYRASEVRAVPVKGSLILGDAIHNLRSALDHLAYQLVIAAGSVPTDSTQFPIRRSRCKHNPCTGRVEPTPLYVSGGISADAMSLLDQVQPYQRGNNWKRDPLWILQQLDVVDKHRKLVLGVAAIKRSNTRRTSDDPVLLVPLPKDVTFVGKCLKDEQVFARLDYDVPCPQLDPYRHFTAHIAFDQGTPLVGVNSVVKLCAKLIEYVEGQIIRRFERELV